MISTKLAIKHLIGGQKASKDISDFGKKTVSDVKNEYKKAIDKTEKWLNSKTIIDTNRTVRTSYTHMMGKKSVTQNVTITDGALTKAVNKGKRWLSRKLFR